MKKSYIYQMAALLALSLVACSEDDMSSAEGTNRFGEQEIGFMPTSTRADITDLEGGFSVYATKGNTPAEYMIAGGTYYFNSDWDWNGTSYSWPDATTDYPVKFYAFYLNDAYEVNDDDVSTLNSDVTVLEVGSQVDILSATQETNVRPVGGKLSLEFSHIMTCINLTIDATVGSLLHIQSVKFVGVDDENTYDFLTSSWGETTSIASDTPSYAYLSVQNPASIIINETDSKSTTIKDATTAITSTSGSLFLMPQILSPWNLTTTLADARVEIIFRSTAVVEEATESDTQIGYVEAQDHPDYTDGSEVSATSPLFIRVAYPLISSSMSEKDYTWVDGYSYNYAVTLGHNGVTNGYFASDKYYDEDGDETEFEIDNAEVGEEVTPGEIHFTPSIINWIPATSISLD
ncbi:MAG: fimbrillin family protein [Rikenellaceae bacterium]